MDSGEHRPEQLFGYRHLCHLKDGHPGVGDYLGSNLYQLQLDAGERQVGSIPWEGEAAHEVTGVSTWDIPQPSPSSGLLS